MKSENIPEVFRRLKKQNPNPTTELAYHNPYTLLVAVILSAQATDIGVNKATKPLFKKVKTPQQMLTLGEEKLRTYIKTIGLYRNKARHVITCSQQLLEKHGGEVPPSRKDLEALAGVGRKTANVILNTVFGEPTIAVDTHLFRLGNRTGLAKGKNVSEVEQAYIKRVPQAYAQNAHHWLILHARYICKARKPSCEACTIADLCDFGKKHI